MSTTATLSLEYIAVNIYDELRAFEGFERAMGVPPPRERIPHPGPWVAEVTLDPAGKQKYDFVRGYRDYTQANSKRTRGVMMIYELDAGKLYRIKARPTWRGARKYWATVSQDGCVIEIDDAAALAMLNKGGQHGHRADT